ncbi:MAG: cobalamin transport system substrate-binding protein [Clostridiales bacterium]|nr:cobalamin transport system substrate-binding protein [Clostridiales bacterium]
MNKKFWTLVFGLVLVLSLAGCRANQNDTESNNETQASVVVEPKAEEEVPSVDRAGNEIKVPDSIQTVMSLAPSITETLVDLGEADKLVAVDTYSVGLDGVADGLPAFDMMNPDIEQMAQLKPDLVFITGMSLIDGQDPYKQLEDLGICVICIPTSASIEAIKEDILFLGQVFGESSKGEAIIEAMQEKIDTISKIGATITDKKTVYFEIGAAPYMYSFGSGVFLDEMLTLIGAENIFSKEEGWINVEAESVVSKNPEVILTNVNYIENPCDEILARDGFSNISAVQNKQVYYIDNMASSLPNENIVTALEQMAKAVYPEFYE